VTAAASPANWGRRLSDRIRDALAAGRLEEAVTLAAEGDGQARSLEKEYALMYKGLGITIRVLLGLLATTVAGHARAEAALTALLQRFRREFARRLEGAYGTTAAGAALADVGDLAPAAPAGLTDELSATRALIERAEGLFDGEQGRLAREAAAAIAAGDAGRALALLDEKERRQYVPLHDRLVRFMAEVFGHVVEHFGPDALLRFHRATADGQRQGFEKWERLGAAGLTRATVFLATQHMATVRVLEDAEKFTIVQTPCGSGGRLRLAGAYEGPAALPLVEGPGPLTLGQPRLPAYCTHCPVWNSLAPIEWFGHPQLVFDDASRPDGSCTVHVYKDPAHVPAAYYERLGVARERR
jgi:hypothetical protein